MKNNSVVEIEYRSEQLSHQEGSNPKDLIHVVGDFADLRPLKKIHRQIHHFGEYISGNLGIDPRRHKQHEKLPQPGKCCLKYNEDQHHQADHIKRIKRLVVDHLVREHAPEQDWRQRDANPRTNAQIATSRTIQRSRKSNATMNLMLNGWVSSAMS